MNQLRKSMYALFLLFVCGAGIVVYANNGEQNVIASFNTALSQITDQIEILRQEHGQLQKEMDLRNSTRKSVQNIDTVLVVAGHTSRSPGAVFGDFTEYELNYDVMQRVGKLLKQTDRFDYILSHQGDDYIDELLDYFRENEESIIAFRDRKIRDYLSEYPTGAVTNDTDHNYASPRAAVELYGVNKWLSSNNIDLAVHIHFNDYPGRVTDVVGQHQGFSVFIPPKTNDHFVESYLFAKYLESEMLKHSKRSSVPRESAGVLESELIATGHRNTVDTPSVLLEAGFIYEEKFYGEQRDESLDAIANSIYRAIVRYDTSLGR